MPEVKQLLKELQSTDSELFSLTVSKNAIPKKIDKLKQVIEDIKARFENLKTSVINAKKELKLTELELASKEEAVAKYNSQLYSAKTNEEYKAFLREIETAEKKKSEIEDKIIAIMEKIEAEQAQLKHREAEHEAEIAEQQKEIKEIETEFTELEKKCKIMAEKRERLRSELTPEVLAIYDRIHKNKASIAVAYILEDNRCSACLNPIPAQQVIEIAHTKVLQFCEYCGRILI